MSTAVPTLTLEGKVVAVTGASRGIGAACATACSAAGARRIVMLARSREGLAAVGEKVRAGGAEALALACDLTVDGEVRAAFGELDELDVLVNAAGTNQPEPFAQVEMSTFDRLMRINVRALFLATQCALPAIRRAEGDRAIVNISSQMGHVGAAGRTVYCATKHAVEGLTKALGVELAPAGIRVVTVAPTFVRTPMTEAQLDDPDIGPRLLDRIPRGRFGTPQEVAGAVVFAASAAAGLMTGSSLVVDGGWIAQ